jgi:drug/metabolite transporter (DMT)-like permease
MAILLAGLSAMAWGGADFFGGLLSRTRNAYAVVGASQFAGFVAITLAAFVTGGFAQDRAWLYWSIGAAIFGTTGLVTFYRALAAGTMGVVSPIAALGVVVPVIVALVGGERPSEVALVGGVLALVGAVLASGPELSGRSGVAPVVLAGIAGLCFGSALLFMAKGAESSPLMLLWGMRLTTVVVFLGVALATRSLGNLTKRDVPMIVAIGLADAGANFFYSIATTLGYLSIVSVVSSLYPVATVLLAAWLLHERMQRIQIVGVCLALSGVAFVSVG